MYETNVTVGIGLTPRSRPRDDKSLCDEIMDEALKIECEWWGRANGENDISQVSQGAIGISVGDQWLTRLED